MIRVVCKQGKWCWKFFSVHRQWKFCIVSKLNKRLLQQFTCCARNRNARSCQRRNIADKFIHHFWRNFSVRRIIESYVEWPNQRPIQHYQFVTLALSICDSRKIFCWCTQSLKCCIVYVARIRLYVNFIIILLSLLLSVNSDICWSQSECRKKRNDFDSNSNIFTFNYFYITGRNFKWIFWRGSELVCKMNQSICCTRERCRE